MTYNQFKEKSDKEFDELFPQNELGGFQCKFRDGGRNERQSVKKFIAARDQALIKVLRECVPETPNEAPKDFWKWFDDMDIRVHDKMTYKTFSELKKEILEEFIEAGANLEHDRWARWMKYMILRMERRKDGTLRFNDEDFGRWAHQMITPYEKLTKKEKESDRKETRNYVPLIEKSLDLIAREAIDATKTRKKSGRPLATEDIYREIGFNECRSQSRKQADEFMKEKI